MGKLEFILAIIAVNDGPFSKLMKKPEDRLILKSGQATVMIFILENWKQVERHSVKDKDIKITRTDFCEEGKREELNYQLWVRGEAQKKKSPKKELKKKRDYSELIQPPIC